MQIETSNNTLTILFAADIIKNWIRTRYALEFLGIWEQINNPNFKVVEFYHFKSQAGLHNFVLSVSEWIEKSNATNGIKNIHPLIFIHTFKSRIINSKIRNQK